MPDEQINGSPGSHRALRQLQESQLLLHQELLSTSRQQLVNLLYYTSVFSLHTISFKWC